MQPVQEEAGHPGEDRSVVPRRHGQTRGPGRGADGGGVMGGDTSSDASSVKTDTSPPSARRERRGPTPLDSSSPRDGNRLPRQGSASLIRQSSLTDSGVLGSEACDRVGGRGLRGVPGSESYDRSIGRGPPGSEGYDRSIARGPPGSEAYDRSIARGPPGSEGYDGLIARGPPGSEAYDRSIARGPPGSEANDRSIARGPPGSEAYDRSIVRGPPGSEAYDRSITRGPPGSEGYDRSIVRGPPGSEAHDRSIARGPTGSEAYDRSGDWRVPRTSQKGVGETYNPALGLVEERGHGPERGQPQDRVEGYMGVAKGQESPVIPDRLRDASGKPVHDPDIRNIPPGFSHPDLSRPNDMRRHRPNQHAEGARIPSECRDVIGNTMTHEISHSDRNYRSMVGGRIVTMGMDGASNILIG